MRISMSLSSMSMKDLEGAVDTFIVDYLKGSPYKVKSKSGSDEEDFCIKVFREGFEGIFLRVSGSFESAIRLDDGDGNIYMISVEKDDSLHLSYDGEPEHFLDSEFMPKISPTAKDIGSVKVYHKEREELVSWDCFFAQNPKAGGCLQVHLVDFRMVETTHLGELKETLEEFKYFKRNTLVALHRAYAKAGIDMPYMDRI